MNKIRTVVESMFGSPIQTMSFAQYFAMINEQGKWTARSALELSAVILTYLEEQERVNDDIKTSFDEIEKILTNLSIKPSDPIVDNRPTYEPSSPPNFPDLPAENVLVCDICRKSFKKKIGLVGHMRSHKS